MLDSNLKNHTNEKNIQENVQEEALVMVKRNNLSNIKRNKIQNFAIYFYIYAFLGWIIDVSICLISDGVLQNRGFLFEPICPMYGFAALVLLLTLSPASRKRNAKDFFKAIIICTVIEYATSLILEVIFHIRWWDYSKEYFNLNGRICLAASVFWGMLSILFIREIHPFIKKTINKFFSHRRKGLKGKIIKTLIILTSIDFVLSVINYIVIF